jgi:endonuclease III
MEYTALERQQEVVIAALRACMETKDALLAVQKKQIENYERLIGIYKAEAKRIDEALKG